MTERRDRIRVHIEGKEYSVVGGDFQDMLAAVKQITGRRFVGELKVWQLPGTAVNIQYQLEIGGYRLEGGTPVVDDLSTTGQTSPPRTSGDRIRIMVGGHRLAVVGGSFQDMLATVKSLPGRRFDGEAKIWEIPGDPALVKGMIETAGFQLEGVENISLDLFLPMEPPQFSGASEHDLPPAPLDPPNFSGSDDVPPFEPPDWWDDELVSPPFEDSHDPDEPMPFDEEPSPFEAGPPSPTFTTIPADRSGSDRIRIRLGDTPLVVIGGSFQDMLAVIKNIPGRRFNRQDKVWEIPDDVTLDSVDQAIRAAGFVVGPE